MEWIKKRLWPNKVSVLMVCHANICRSPMAEGILKHLLAERGLDNAVRVDSAGTHAGPLSSRPDARAQRVCLARGINIAKLKSREIKLVDFQRFNYILVMDDKNLESIKAMCPDSSHNSISRVLDYSDAETTEVPDPYYGNEAGFERVFELMYEALSRFVDREFADNKLNNGNRP